MALKATGLELLQPAVFLMPLAEDHIAYDPINITGYFNRRMASDLAYIRQRHTGFQHAAQGSMPETVRVEICFHSGFSGQALQYLVNAVRGESSGFIAVAFFPYKNGFAAGYIRPLCQIQLQCLAGTLIEKDWAGFSMSAAAFFVNNRLAQ